jgi:hypothetical protein
MNHERLWSDEHMGFSSEGPEGIIVIRWPRKITAAQLEYLEGLTALCVKAARRQLPTEPEPPAAPEPDR